MKKDLALERKIIIGLIASSEYLSKIRKEVDPALFQSTIATMIAGWCIEYFDQYNIAPGKDIEQIYYDKLTTTNIQKEVAEEIEEDILPDLSDEYSEAGINVEYLLKQSFKYFQARRLILLRENLEDTVERGDLESAENLLERHKTTVQLEDEVVLNHDGIRESVKKAFSTSYSGLITYPGALGQFWNSSMVRGGFVALLSPEKRGKSWMLLDAAMRAVQQGVPVAFFQAGDMTTDQQLRRIGIYLAKCSDKEKYTGKQLLPVKDCALNQLNLCSKGIRECDFGIFEDRNWDEHTLRKEVTMDDLKEAFRTESGYKNCYNCSDYGANSTGAVWLEERDIKNPLSAKKASTLVYDFFVKKQRELRISTHPNGTLTIKKMRQILNTWRVRDAFVPAVIIMDYLDLYEDDSVKEYRHKQNKIWKDARGLGQELNALMLTVTQSDADSYGVDTLSLKNFSEDKRKYSHVTAMYGLNQDRTGREKKLGILRINELLLREDEFDVTRCVTVLQGLKIGRPILYSYF